MECESTIVRAVLFSLVVGVMMGVAGALFVVLYLYVCGPPNRELRERELE